MTRLTGASALALIAMTGWAQADVTPQQVWDDLEAYMQSYGYDVAGTETASGDTLTVNDVAFTTVMPDDGGMLSVDIGRIVLTDLGDGTVSVTFPSTMPIRVQVNDGTEAVDLTVNYTQENLEMIVSGTPGAMVYDYTADALGFTLAEMSVEGDSAPPDVVRFTASMGPVEGRSEVVTEGDMRQLVQSVSLGDLSYDFAAQDPAGGDGGSFGGSMTNLAVEGDGIIPADVDLQDMAAALAAGLTGGGRITHEGGEIRFSVTEGDSVTNGEVTSTSGFIEVDLSGDGLLYSVGGTGTALAMTVPDFPFPINAEWAESGFEMFLPLQPSEEPQDAEIGLTLAEFTMADQLWSLFDPTAIMPRDPATIIIDLTAQVTPNVSLLDPEAMAALETTGEVPGELNALTLDELRIEAAGARLTGTGEFTFDNSDLENSRRLPASDGQDRPRDQWPERADRPADPDGRARRAGCDGCAHDAGHVHRPDRRTGQRDVDNRDQRRVSHHRQRPAHPVGASATRQGAARAVAPEHMNCRSGLPACATCLQAMILRAAHSRPANPFAVRQSRLICRPREATMKLRLCLSGDLADDPNLQSQCCPLACRGYRFVFWRM